MKKIIAAACLLCLFAFSTNNEKPLTVSGNIQDWSNVIQCLESSNAPHMQVMAAHEFLVQQLNAQLDTTIKK